MTTLDFRSDTVTRPTPAMREAMARAEVGDDAYGDDPSVVALEQRVAALLGKSAALFVPSGTMANQLAVAGHAAPGQTIATSPGAHVRIHEDASAAALSGVQLMPIGGRAGYTVDEARALIDETSCGWPPVAALWIENTLGDAGGRTWPLHHDEPHVSGSTGIATLARDRGVSVHIDGARLWNAHVATATPLADLCAAADTVSVCFSKGLGAPAGSALAGPTDWIARARRRRHALGGGMRQAGVLAAAASHALDHHVQRLADDHGRAARLARGLQDLPGLEVGTPATNIVLAEVGAPWSHAEALCAPLRAAGLLCFPNRYRQVRWVVHLHHDDAAIDEAIARIRGTVERLTS